MRSSLPVVSFFSLQVSRKLHLTSLSQSSIVSIILPSLFAISSSDHFRLGSISAILPSFLPSTVPHLMRVSAMREKERTQTLQLVPSCCLSVAEAMATSQCRMSSRSGRSSQRRQKTTASRDDPHVLERARLPSGHSMRPGRSKLEWLT